MKNGIKFIISFIKTVLWIAIILLLAIILVQRISNNKKSIAGLRIFTVISPSMVPKYHLGDSILVKYVAPENLKVGDDITYLGEKESFKDKIVTHRIVNIEKKEDGKYSIETRGIANDKSDPLITEAQVYGKVIYKIKSITKLNSVMGNLYGMYFVIVVPMALIVLWDFIAGRREKKAYKNEKETDEENTETSESIKETKNRVRNRRRHRRENRRNRKNTDEE